MNYELSSKFFDLRLAFEHQEIITKAKSNRDLETSNHKSNLVSKSPSWQNLRLTRTTSVLKRTSGHLVVFLAPSHYFHNTMLKKNINTLETRDNFKLKRILIRT